MKLRSTAGFVELEQKVVGFTDLRILIRLSELVQRLGYMSNANDPFITRG